MALFAALCGVVRGDIARAEPASCADETDRLALVLLGVVQDILVELVLLHRHFAGIAAPRVRLPLALNTLVGIGWKGCWVFLQTARGAGVARYTTHCPIPAFFSRMVPLTVAKFVLLETLAAY